jgi:hypothetical protein
MAETGTIRKIAFAPWSGTPPAEVAQPSTLPAVGSNMVWASNATWDDLLLGGQPGGADIGHLDEESIKVTPLEESVEIDPPLAQQRLDEIMIANGVEKFNFRAYSCTAAVSALSSGANSDVAEPEEGEIEEGLEILWYSMCIEITGLRLLYFPKAEVRVTDEEGSVLKGVTKSFECQIYGTSAIPSGMKAVEFTAA